MLRGLGVQRLTSLGARDIQGLGVLTLATPTMQARLDRSPDAVV